MKLTQKETEVVEILRNLSHENVDRIMNFLTALNTQALLNYADNEPITIPLFGTFYIRYKGDKITDSGREADLETFFDPSPYLKENIGSYEDFKKSKNKDVTTIPIMRHFENLNKQALKMTMNDVNIGCIDE